MLVVFSHAFVLSGNSEPLLGTAISLGTIGVFVFFILSGYLISISWDQYPRFNVFFAKRALRIFPGLIVNILLTLLVLGTYFSTLPALEFFTQQESLNFLSNIFLYNPQGYLPGVFTQNTYEGAINGSLWTLPYEFTMYIIVALIGVLGIYKKMRPYWLWLGLFVLQVLILLIGKDHFQLSIFFLQINFFVMLALLFFSGVMMHKYSHKIKLSYSYGIASLGIFIASAFIVPLFIIPSAAVFLAYALFSLGKSPAFSSVGKVGDLSYGMYIYSFPVQQALYATWQISNPFTMFALSLILSVGLALLSWHLIEKRTLRLKHKVNLSRYPLTQSESAW